MESKISLEAFSAAANDANATTASLAKQFGISQSSVRRLKKLTKDGNDKVKMSKV